MVGEAVTMSELDSIDSVQPLKEIRITRPNNDDSNFVLIRNKGMYSVYSQMRTMVGRVLVRLFQLSGLYGTLRCCTSA